jgi:lipid A 3-O-deacylase
VATDNDILSCSAASSEGQSVSRPSVLLSRRPPWACLGGAATLFALFYALLTPADAAPVSRDVVGATASRLEHWTLGDLAYGLPPLDIQSDDRKLSDSRLSSLNNKMRLGGSLMPGIEAYAVIRPWIGMGGDGGGRALTSGGPGSNGVSGMMGGVLIDVPLGSFVFTPSFGASLGPTNLPRAQRDAGATTEFRSQLELGYVFDNKSRFSLGYSRIATDGNAVDPATAPNNVFGFYYRLPFGGP